MPANNQGLPLPSTGSGSGPNTSAKPNPTGAAAQAGVGAENLSSINNFSKRLDELGNKLRYRIENITSVTQTAQQGAFNAFGNNFVTRAGIQSVGAVKDAFQTFTDRRTEEEKAKDDPVLAAALTLKEIKRHSGMLEHIVEATRTTTDLLMDMIEKDKSEDIVKGLNELAVLFQNPAQVNEIPDPTPAKEKATKIKVDDIIDPVKDTEEIDRKVKDTVNVKARVVPDKEPKPTAEQKREKNREQIIDVETVEVKPEQQHDVVDVQEIKPTENLLRIGNDSKDVSVPSLPAPQITPTAKEVVDVQEIKPAENLLRIGNDSKDVVDIPEKNKSNKEDVAEKNTEKNTEKMLFIMTSMNKNMERLVAGPMSNQEDLLEAGLKKPSIASPIATEQKSEKSEGWWEKLLGLGPLKSVFGLLTSGVTGLVSAFSGAAKMIFTVIKSLGGKALAGMGKAGGMFGGKGGKGFKGGLIGMGVGLGADLAADALGRDTKGGAVADTLGTAASWAGTGAMIGSVIPGVGTAIGGVVGGVAGAAKGLYDNWDTISGSKPKRVEADELESDDAPDLLSPSEIRDGSMLTDPNRAGIIEENEREVARMRKSAEAAKERSQKESMMQIVNSNVTNNSLIMPSRRYARNMDSSFNTYLKTSF